MGPEVRTIGRLLEPAEGFASSEVGSFVAQFDDLSRRLAEDLAGISPEELSWQPSPGQNTIGMLLAHMAIVEVHWINVGVLEIGAGHVEKTLGIAEPADGIPLAEGAEAPAELSGKSFAWFQELEKKAREHTYTSLKDFSDEGLTRSGETLVMRGTLRIIHNVRWVLYHVLEHYAGHYGQILMMRHQFRDAH